MIRSTAIAFAALAAVGSAALAAPEIKLEGTSQRRAVLDPMQYQPFDAARWSLLSDWTGGQAPDAASTAGRPVLIVTFAGWYRSSHDGLKLAQELYREHGSQGLMVVGVHHQRSFESAADVVKAQGVTFPYAHDAEGKFRQEMKVDGDPDFYLIDRAGRLRYADLSTPSVAAAVEQLVSETPEQAAAAQPPAPATASKPGEAPKKVDPASYSAAKWPAHNKGRLSAKNLQGKKLPGTLGAKEKFLGEKPDWQNKVVVIDFWATWCPPCKKAIPKLEDLQEKLKDDVVVIGLSDEPEAKVRGFLKQGEHGYAQAIDTSKALSNALGVQGIPHVVVLSSDGVIRWQGNPLQNELEQAIRDVVAADPGVQARKRG